MTKKDATLYFENEIEPGIKALKENNAIDRIEELISNRVSELKKTYNK